MQRPTDQSARESKRTAILLHRQTKGSRVTPLVIDNNPHEYRCVTVVVRLVFDDHGQLSHGEFVEVANSHQERFVGWRQLLHLGRRWLSLQQVEDTAEP